jgi:hypothetical protein
MIGDGADMIARRAMSILVVPYSEPSGGELPFAFDTAGPGENTRISYL